jgi:hypothetical protein
LVPHPGVARPPFDIGVEVTWSSMDALRLEYMVRGRIDDLSIPARAQPARLDGLWRYTCFEAFARFADQASYLEYNLSPSTEWAAYHFDRHREGMRDAEVNPPEIGVERNDDRLVLTADIALPDRPVVTIGLSAVIETRDGAKSYWALAHPPGKPDFHHPDCFALELPAAGGS